MDGTAGPRVVGRYLLYDAIASGGMATVHLGRLLGPVGFSRTVAIKRMHDALAQDPDFAQMFIDEARLVTRIRHPNVVPTLDVVSLDNELLLVMEYVAGEPLSVLLRRARAAKVPPPIGVLVDIAVGVLHGLHAAHEARDEKGEPLNIVHRDVSPQNILVGTDGVARVLDFGVAKSAARTHQTRDGQVKGKLHYMAPEQLRGKPLSPATDIFALGLMLWEALTGEDAFPYESEADLVHNMLHTDAAPPSTLRPDIPRVLDDIILQALNKEPAQRFISAKAMASALESAIPSVPRSAVGKWVVECARDDLKRKAWHVACVESDFSHAGGVTPARSERASSPPRDTPVSGSSPALALPSTPIPQLYPMPPARSKRNVIISALATAAFVGGVALMVRTAAPPAGDAKGSPSFPASARTAALEPQPVEPTPTAAEPAAAATARAPAASASASSGARAKSAPKTRPTKEDPGDRIYRRE
jgi:serine/threonine-protein kinase